MQEVEQIESKEGNSILDTLIWNLSVDYPNKV